MRGHFKKDKIEIHKLVNSPLKVAIIAFFQQNPSCIDTPKGIATWVGRDPQDVEKAMVEMGQDNLLIVHRMRSAVGYGYTQDKNLIVAIEEFLKT